MEKAKRLKTLKVLFVAGFVIIFIGFLLLQAWSGISGLGFPYFSIIYWLTLFGWLFLIWNYKLESYQSLLPAFIFFVFGALLTVFGLFGIAEIFMRISLMGWLVGIVQALTEYKTHHD